MIIVRSHASFLSLAALLCAFVVEAGESVGSDSEPWLVGTATVDITPTAPIWMGGFASRTRIPTVDEVLASRNSLHMRVLALRTHSPTSALVLVSLDLIGANAHLTDRIYSRLLEEHSMSRASVRICFSHTHSGPVVGRNLFPLVPEGESTAINDYADWLVDAVVDGVARALRLKDMISAYAYFSIGSSTISVNRRQIVEAMFVAGESSRGETDDSLPVLWLVADDGGIVAGVFGYSAHATVVTSGYSFSGDYPAAAVAALEGRSVGNSSVGGTWLFVAGVGGDQNIYPRGTIDHAQHHGLNLAVSVAHVISASVANGARPVSSASGLAAVHEFVELTFRAQRTRRELRKMTRVRNDVYEQRMARHWLLKGIPRLASTTPSTYATYPVSVWRIGSVRIAFLGGEPTVGFGSLLRRAGADWVVGYADDVMGYVATKDVLEKGQREGSHRAATYYGLPATWSTAVEDVVVDAVSRICRRLTVHPSRAGPEYVNDEL
jgi:neutral ceramidase